MRNAQITGFCALFVSLLVLGSSCEKAPHLKPGYVSLDECLMVYHEAFRWRDYDAAMEFIVPAERDNFREHVESIKGKISVESYKVVKANLDKEKYKAVVHIKRNYTLLPSVTLREDQFEQEWVLVGKSWYLTGPPF